MKQMLDYADILIKALLSLGYVWTAGKFLKKYLGVSKSKERLFLIFSFSGWLVLEIMNRRYSVPYIFPVASSHVFFVGLVLLLFEADVEKKILAASLLMAAKTLVENFCASFLSCLALFSLHIVKRIPEPFLNEWEVGSIACVSFIMVIVTVCWMSKNLASVFCGKPGRWYVILAVPLL